MKTTSMKDIFKRLEYKECIEIFYKALMHEETHCEFENLQKRFDINEFILKLKEEDKLINYTSFEIEEILKFCHEENSFKSLYSLSRSKGIPSILYLCEIADFLFLKITEDADNLFEFLKESTYDEKRINIILKDLKGIKEKDYVIERRKNFNKFILTVQAENYYVTKRISLKEFKEMEEIIEVLNELSTSELEQELLDRLKKLTSIKY